VKVAVQVLLVNIETVLPQPVPLHPEKI